MPFKTIFNMLFTNSRQQLSRTIHIPRIDPTTELILANPEGYFRELREKEQRDNSFINKFKKTFKRI